MSKAVDSTVIVQNFINVVVLVEEYTVVKGDILKNHFDTLKCRAVRCIYVYICECFAYIYYEGKWQGCHSERPSQVGGMGQQEPYEIQ